MIFILNQTFIKFLIIFFIWYYSICF